MKHIVSFSISPVEDIPLNKVRQTPTHLSLALLLRPPQATAFDMVGWQGHHIVNLHRTVTQFEQ
jgi:hypothetical protein